MAGRLGDALGTLGGVKMGGSQIILTCVTAGVFIICSLLFFALYQKLYAAAPSQGSDTETMLREFEAKYALTARQSEIFRLSMGGATYAEISSELFLAESTIKFHMKNILTKANCATRTELLTLFKSGGNE